MGTIISSRKEGEKIVVELAADYDEFLQLKGHFEDVYLMTNKVANIQTNISQRGKNEATKYFLIPRQLRKGFRFNNTTSCQRLDFDGKAVFIYVIDKNSVNLSRRQRAIENTKVNY